MCGTTRQLSAEHLPGISAEPVPFHHLQPCCRYPMAPTPPPRERRSLTRARPPRSGSTLSCSTRPRVGGQPRAELGQGLVPRHRAAGHRHGARGQRLAGGSRPDRLGRRGLRTAGRRRVRGGWPHPWPRELLGFRGYHLQQHGRELHRHDAAIPLVPAHLRRWPRNHRARPQHPAGRGGQRGSAPAERRPPLTGAAAQERPPDIDYLAQIAARPSSWASGRCDSHRHLVRGRLARDRRPDQRDPAAEIPRRVPARA